jgi:ABC-type multidrug transport system fused ATPase/permease subunit
MDLARPGLRRVAGYFRPHITRIILILLLMAVGAVLALVPALVLKELLDHLAQRNSSFWFIVLVVLAGAASVRSAIIRMANESKPSAP